MLNFNEVLTEKWWWWWWWRGCLIKFAITVVLHNFYVHFCVKSQFNPTLLGFYMHVVVVV